MAKILITGSTGFIGKELLANLKYSDHEILELNHSSGDISDESIWSSLPKTDVVVHLAARTFVPDSWADPLGFLKTNLQGTICALNYCKNQEARLVFLSSYMYGNPELLPISESAVLHACNPYALSKKLAEDVCRFYADNFKVGIAVLRPFNVYGPMQHDDFLIPMIIKQAMTQNVIHVKDLEPKRDYIYIDDVVECIIRAFELDSNFNVFNIGTGISYSVAKVIDIIQKNLGTDFPVQSSNERRQEEVMETQADISKAAAILGWKPKWSLQQGIAEILAAMKKEEEKT